VTYKKKLIEVALPLEAISIAAAAEKNVRFGHPSTLHLWWSRKPLAACRAVLFASLVDDPSEHPELFPTIEEQDEERLRLFRLMESLVKWENTTNDEVLKLAREEIRKSSATGLPAVFDPFCGGGSIPLEAQRLDLETFASDLNPVAVLITRALVDIPGRFRHQVPVNPESTTRLATGAEGVESLVEDVAYYGQWMRNAAQRRLGHIYPAVALPGVSKSSANVVAWLWARTVSCPNPGCGAEVPLCSKFWLSKKRDQKAWLVPQVDPNNKRVRFEIRTGEGTPPPGTVNRTGASCLVCNSPISLGYIRQEGRSGRLGTRLLCVVAERDRRRVFIPASEEQERIAAVAEPEGGPVTPLPEKALGFRVQAYGMRNHRELFTPRQLSALVTFTDLIPEVRDEITKDAVAAGHSDDGVRFSDGGSGATAYADAVVTYLALAISRLADISNAFCMWEPGRTQVRHLFTRQAIAMMWDFAEPNIFGGGAGDFAVSLRSICNVLERLPAEAGTASTYQLDARHAARSVVGDRIMVSTDPPYYDNIGYSDLADFFYVWLRLCLKDTFPELFSTLLSPKQEELVASPFRFEGDRKRAEVFFEEGLAATFSELRKFHSPDYPMTVYYAFKQAEVDQDDDSVLAVASTGWETMLNALLGSGYQITGTWPIRSEMSNRPVASGTNALASSIVLACRLRPTEAPLATRKEFFSTLRAELPGALLLLQHGNVAPVDLAQAAIGPGMAVFSRYSKILEADGSSMRVRTALELINQVLTEVLSEQEDEFDSATRWAISWFEQYATNEGPFGEADVLARAKGVAVNGLVQDGLVVSGRGRVRLLRSDELSRAWDLAKDERLRVWEVTHHLVGKLMADGEEASAVILRQVGDSYGALARDLAYRLFNTCERRKWAQEALGYNQLVVSWPEIQRLAGRDVPPTQQTLE
jgi:putative DNA methylase